MSMCICEMCDNLIDTDGDCGEWDIQDRDGNYYNYICEDCAANSEELINCDSCEVFTTDDDSILHDESDQRTCNGCIKIEHDKYLSQYIAETGKNPYAKKEHNNVTR